MQKLFGADIASRGFAGRSFIRLFAVARLHGEREIKDCEVEFEASFGCASRKFSPLTTSVSTS